MPPVTGVKFVAAVVSKSTLTIFERLVPVIETPVPPVFAPPFGLKEVIVGAEHVVISIAGSVTKIFVKSGVLPSESIESALMDESEFARDVPANIPIGALPAREEIFEYGTFHATQYLVVPLTDPDCAQPSSLLLPESVTTAVYVLAAVAGL